MARVTLLSTSVRVAAIAAAVISGTALLPSAPAQADACPNIEVIFARGTHDDPGMGRVGSVLVDALQPLVGSRTVTGYVEPAAASAAPEQSFQFERTGYFVADRYDHTPERPVFNRSVTLRDTWATKA